MAKLHENTNRKCPKCKSRFGVILAKNLNKGKSQVICFNADCDFKMNILEWNKKYTRSQFKDSGYLHFVGNNEAFESREEVAVGCHTCRHNPHAPFIPEICNKCNPKTLSEWQPN